MADVTGQFKLKVKGFQGVHTDYLRFSKQVPDEVKCQLCECIPKEIYPAVCFKHGLCADCKKISRGYYCQKCRITTGPEQLQAVGPHLNYQSSFLCVVCNRCEKEMPLKELEEHIIRCPTFVKCPLCDDDVLNRMIEKHRLNECPMRLVRCDACFCNVALRNKDKHTAVCPKVKRKCSQCDADVLNEDLQYHLSTECQKRLVSCGACHKPLPFDEIGEHISECPKREKKCFRCDANILNEDFSCHLNEKCPKRPVYCDTCNTSTVFDELSKHKSECPKREKKCFRCDANILNEDLSYHMSERCPKRQVRCDACLTSTVFDELSKHTSECARVKITCSKCGVSVLRGYLNHHLNTACKVLQASCDACYRRYTPSDELEKARGKILELEAKIKELEERNRKQLHCRLDVERRFAEQEKLLQKEREENLKLEKRVRELENRQH